MRRAYVFVCFLLTVFGCRAQYGTHQFFSTPAQRDWLENESAITATDPREMDRPSDESVSVARLRHKPNRKSLARFSRGLKYAESEAWDSAALEFKMAAERDPEFPEAHCDLGVAYTGMGRLEEAAGAFRRAIALDPATSVHHGNLAYVLILLKREKEALREAQVAVALDASNVKGQFLLGYLLSRRPESHQQAAAHLADAAREMPEAHLALAEMYLAEGAAPIARAELEQYQKTAPAHGSVRALH